MAASLRNAATSQSESIHPNPYPPIEDDDPTFAASLEQSVAAVEASRSTNTSQRQMPGKMWPQVFAAVAACMGGLVMGTHLGWSAPVLFQLTDNSTAPHEFPVTTKDQYIIGSLLPIGAFLGSIFGGYSSSRLGRKGAMFVAAGVFTLSYLFLICASHVEYLFIGRVIAGIGCGLTTTSSPNYIAEISSPHIRGLLGSSFQLFVTFGLLFSGCVGMATTWRWLGVACVVPIGVWIVMMLIVPESPAYLLGQREFEAGRKSLQFLRGSIYVETELAEIQDGIEEAAFKSGTFKDYKKPENLKPLLISLILMFGQQFSGINAVLFNTVAIFEAAKTPMNSYLENIILGIMQVAGTLVGTLLIDKLGRRILLIFSDILMTAAIGGLGAYFFISEKSGEEAGKIAFLPLLCLALYILAFAVAFGPIPWLMLSELISPEMKSLSNSIASGFNWIFAFFVTYFYGDAKRALGLSTTFWGFGTFLLMTLVGIILAVPETKGRSLEEIQSLFRTSTVSVPADDRESIVNNEEQNL